MAKRASTLVKKRAARASSQYADRICNLIPSRDTERDWTVQDALASGALAAPAALPEKVDLRETWWNVGDQLRTGSCVGWATVDGVMRYHLVKAGRVKKDEPLSVRFVWMGSKETDEFNSRPQTFVEEAGTSLKSAVDIVRKYGVVQESLLPFQLSTLMYLGTETSLYATASTRRAAGYYNLKKNTSVWKAWLVEHGPILAGVSIDATWDNATASGGNLRTFQPATVRGGHAVCVVGYMGDKFIIRNSWGKTWGNKGFAYASQSYVNDGFFAESYGVTL